MTHRVFFLEKFLVWGENLACDNVFLPRTDKEYDAVESVYREKGLPGCVGSIDCVHVTWDNCRSGLKGECKGKASNPTLAFEVVVDHDRRIQSISTYNFGAQNDKTIAQHDKAVRVVRTPKTFLSRKTFETRRAGQPMRTHRGSYYICDGGYAPYTCLMPPFKDQLETSAYFGWSKHVESLRKDVECTFGILKKRFMILKNPICLPCPEHVQSVFVTCCALHNALLKHDNDSDDNNDYDYENEDEDEDENEDGNETEDENEDNTTDYESEDDDNVMETTTQEQFHDRRNALVEHYNVCVADHSLVL